MLRIKAFLSDGTMIHSNFYHFWDKARSDGTHRYFLIDHKEHVKMRRVYKRCCKDEEETFKAAEEYMGSMTKFAKHFKKTLYLRLIPPFIFGKNQENVVFADDVLEMIPIALKQQRTPIQEDDARLEYFRKRKCHSRSGTYNTLTVTELEKVLDEFDINKSLFKLIPDLSYELTRREHLDCGKALCFLSPDMQTIASVHHNMDILFGAVIMGVNWKNEPCEKHEMCNKELREGNLEVFRTMLSWKPDAFLDCTVYVYMVDTSQECIMAQKTAKGAPDFFMKQRSFDEEVFISQYNAMCKYYGLQKYTSFVPASRRDRMFVWMFRLLAKLGWIQQFFGNDEEYLKEKIMMIRCLYSMVPEEYVEETDEFLKSVVREHPDRPIGSDSNKETAKKPQQHKGQKSKKRKGPK